MAARYGALNDDEAANGGNLVDVSRAVQRVRNRHAMLAVPSTLTALLLLGFGFLKFVEVRAVGGVENASDMDIHMVSSLSLGAFIVAFMALYHWCMLIRAASVIGSGGPWRAIEASEEATARFAEEEWGAHAELRDQAMLLKFNGCVPPRTAWRGFAFFLAVCLVSWPVVLLATTWRIWLLRPFPAGLLWTVAFAVVEVVIFFIVAVLLRCANNYAALRAARSLLPRVLLSPHCIMAHDGYIDLGKWRHCDKNRVVNVRAVHPIAQQPYIEVEYTLVLGKFVAGNPYLLRFPPPPDTDIAEIVATLTAMWHEIDGV